MILVLLEGLEGLEPRILIIQTNDESDVHAIVGEVVEETAAVGAIVERPSHRVLYQTRLHPPRRQLPQFLESQAVSLRRLAGIQLEALDQLLRGAAAATFAKHGDFGVNLRSQREVRSRL